MKVLRTPDSCFDDLPGYGWDPNYVEVPSGVADGESLRVHYIDEGPADAPVVLLMHGEPSWSYLYRKMIPVLLSAGLRCVAIDLVGFGRSDKPASQTDYTYERHVEWMRRTIFDGLGLDDITLMCQDWGGLIGLRLVADQPERFAGVVASNTFLPTGDVPPPEAFQTWREMSQSMETFDSGVVVDFGTTDSLGPEIVAAYNAPFPDQTYTAGARVFPLLVPTEPDAPGAAENRAAWKELERFDRPFLTAFSDKDPVTKGGEKVMLARIPGCRDQPHTTIGDAGHFLQEDRGEDLAAVLATFVGSYS